MPLIKICGIKDPATAQFSAECGADYIGIVFAPSSKRFVSLPLAKLIAEAAQKAGAIPVGVFVNMGAQEITALADKTGIRFVQAYGLTEELPQQYSRLYVNERERVIQRPSDFILMETAEPGTGKTFNWDKFVPPSSAWFIAGGLSISNVGEAISLFKPTGVDVSSGVETDGNKDREKIRTFIEQVKTYE